jgi:hypothetical protein
MGLSPGQIIGVVIVTCALILILIVVVWYKVQYSNEKPESLSRPLIPLNSL